MSVYIYCVDEGKIETGREKEIEKQRDRQRDRQRHVYASERWG